MVVANSLAFLVMGFVLSMLLKVAWVRMLLSNYVPLKTLVNGIVVVLRAEKKRVRSQIFIVIYLFFANYSLSFINLNNGNQFHFSLPKVKKFVDEGKPSTPSFFLF